METEYKVRPIASLRFSKSITGTRMETERAEATFAEYPNANEELQNINDVLPDYGKPWYRVPHLLKLNLLLLICMLSSTNNGYDSVS